MEAGDALAHSERQLTTLEGKGQALTSIAAMVAAAIGLAITIAWSDSTTLAKWLLVSAAACDLKSLRAPLVLVKPVQRATPHIVSATAGQTPSLVERKLQAATLNRLTALRLSNLLATSRRDLLKALLLFTAWALLALAGLAAHPRTEVPLQHQQPHEDVPGQDQPVSEHLWAKLPGHPAARVTSTCG
ncbi:MAG: hypothetical protein ACTHN3_10345 [Solirubrobacterales bacterium]